MRGHTEEEGNLFQLLTMWSASDSSLKHWMRKKKYMSHVIINEMITMMGLKALQSLLEKVKECDPAWYAIIADEATDIANREQFTLTIRSVDSDYVISEDPVGLVSLPNTTSDTLVAVLKDLLIRCTLPLSLCRGQACDGAANMLARQKDGGCHSNKKESSSCSASALFCPFTQPVPTRCWEKGCTATRCTRSCATNCQAHTFLS